MTHAMTLRSGALRPMEQRLAATEALAREYLTLDPHQPERAGILATLFECVDDPAVQVRARLAELFANRSDAPRPVVLRLLDDCPAVSAPLFEHSPLLRPQHLIDGIVREDTRIAIAVANRIELTDTIQDCLIERADEDACSALIANPYTSLGEAQIDALIMRFAGDAEILQQLQTFRQLSLVQRCDLVAHHARALSANPLVQAFVPTSRLERLSGMAGERAVLSLLASLVPSGSSETLWTSMDALYKRGFITPAFVLRAAFSGQIDVLEAVIGHLADADPARVRAAVVHPRPAVAAALFKRSGLGASVREVVAMAFVLARELASAQVDWDEGFFAQALSEIVELRLDQAADTEFSGQGDGFDDAVAALCQDLAADILQASARNERDLQMLPPPPSRAASEALFSDTLEGVLIERLVDAA